MRFQLKNLLFAFVFGVTLTGVSLDARSQDFRLDDLTEENAENILEDLAGVTAHTTASGASPLGEEFGFEVGLLASYGQTPTVDRIVGRSDGEEGYDYLPNAGLLGRVGIAEWVVVEGVYLPSTDFGEYNVQVTSLAAQVNLLRGDPLYLAVKAFYGNSVISYTQREDLTTLGVELENDLSGAHVLVSNKYNILEPYLGAGFVKNEGEITVSGETTIFDDSFGDTASADGSGNSNHVFGGVEIDLPALNVGVEAAHLYDNMKYSAKVSVGF